MPLTFVWEETFYVRGEILNDLKTIFLMISNHIKKISHKIRCCYWRIGMGQARSFFITMLYQSIKLEQYWLSTYNMLNKPINFGNHWFLWYMFLKMIFWLKFCFSERSTSIKVSGNRVQIAKEFVIHKRCGLIDFQMSYRTTSTFYYFRQLSVFTPL